MTLLPVHKRNLSLPARVKAYKKAMASIHAYLDRHPDEWGRFQSEFNQEINAIFRDLMDFERENLADGEEGRVYKMKRLFINRFRKEFIHGNSIRQSLKKPYGYAGDFQIIDDIYRNDYQTKGVDRLFDNYAQMSTIAIAIRNRKEDFKRQIRLFAASRKRRPVRVMNLACGPCRDVFELFQSGEIKPGDAVFDCYDQDMHALQYAESLLSRFSGSVRFLKENAIRIAFRKDVKTYIPDRYDLIYSMGLFDYLDHPIGVRLVLNLSKMLENGGMIMIANVSEKYHNPSVYFLEWVGDWNLIYRDEKEFMSIFFDAGYKKAQLKLQSEQQGIIQYILTK